MAPSRLTVAQLVPALDGGGVERGTLEVAAALVERGHRSIVVSGGGRLVDTLVASGSEHVELTIGRKAISTLRYPPRLGRLLREEGVDILHARSRLPAWVGYLAWRGMDPEARPRFLTTVHGLYSVNRYSAIMVRSERIIAVSRTIKEYIARNYPGVAPDRIEIIHRGVGDADFPYGYRPDPAWREAWRASFPELSDRFVVTLPGRVRRRKGHREFFDVVEETRRRGIAIHGLVVGEGDERRGAYAGGLRREVARRDLPITFTGYRGDVREIYAVSDVVVSLSRQPESFGRTVLEALRIGTPVVGFAHGGVGEILDAMYPPGRVVVGDVGAVVDRLVELHERPRRPAPSGAFPLRAMLDRTLALYSELARCPSA